jgi:hypothetical protein
MTYKLHLMTEPTVVVVVVCGFGHKVKFADY